MHRLFVDIETSQNLALIWRPGSRIFVSYKDIVRERAVICVALKWQGDPVQTFTWDRHQCDKAMLRKVIPIIAQADEVVGHNIERFDIGWLRGRALFHGLQLPLVRMVDTLKWARKYYNFNSNRLDYLARFFGIGQKTEAFTEGAGSWRKVFLDNDRRELKRMVEYCANDVSGLLEPVWERFSIVCPAATHAGVIEHGEKWSCPRCASHHVYQNQRKVTAMGSERFTMHCKDCHGYYNISATARNRWLEERNEHKTK